MNDRDAEDCGVTLSPHKALADASAALAAAHHRHKQAEDQVNAARSVETSALNDLNAAQKEFDAATEAIKKLHTSRSSDWHRASRGVPE